jgi:hypothetical protein
MAIPTNLAPPIRTAVIDPKTGLVTVPWAQFYQSLADKLNALYTQVNP